LPLPEVLGGNPTAQAGGPRRSALVAAAQAHGAGDTTPVATDDAFPALDVVDVDAWAMQHAPEELPLPAQILPAVAVTDNAQAADGSAAPLPVDDSGASPFEIAVFAIGLLATAVAGAATYVRTVRTSFGLRQHVQRGLAILRLTLGILRLW